MNIVSTLKKYGVIQEMNDWKKHFTDGTKGQPKTDPEILDFVEDLIFQVFQGNEEKVLTSSYIQQDTSVKRHLPSLSLNL